MKNIAVIALTSCLCAVFLWTAHVQAEGIKPQHAIAMHGTPKYGPDFTHFDYVNPQAPKGGTLRRGASGSFDSFNPFIIKGEAAAGSGNIYDSLLTSSADEAFSAYGLLAERVEMPEDRSWVTFYLRPQAKWHDGQPITAEDVKWTFETLVHKGAPQFRFYYADVAKVEVLDQRTVKFTFTGTNNRELPLILGQLSILPKHYWKDRDFSKTTLDPPLGSGPYKIARFEAGRFVEYTRVKNYWGRDLPVNVGRHNFDTLRYEYFRDANVIVEAFKGGALDFRAENISKVWATAYNMDEVTNGQLIKEKLPHQRTAAIQGYVYNLRRTIFKDPRVRQALAYAFDFDWSNRNLFYSQYTRTRSYFGNSELEAKGLPSADELAILEKYRGRIPDEVFTTAYNPPATQGNGRIRPNLKIADRLLKEAGWVIQGKDRVNLKTGQKLAFEILLVSPAFERITLPFTKNLERLGVRAHVRTVDSAQYAQRMETFDYDMTTSVWGQSLSPGNEQRNYWGSQAAKTNGSRNLIGIQDPVVDALIEGIIAAPDRKALVTHVHALDRVLQWGYYLIPHWYAAADRVLYWNKYSHPATMPMQGSTLDTWWYDKTKAKALRAARGESE